MSSPESAPPPESNDTPPSTPPLPPRTTPPLPSISPPPPNNPDSPVLLPPSDPPTSPPPPPPDPPVPSQPPDPPAQPFAPPPPPPPDPPVLPPAPSPPADPPVQPLVPPLPPDPPVQPPVPETPVSPSPPPPRTPPPPVPRTTPPPPNGTSSPPPPVEVPPQSPPPEGVPPPPPTSSSPPTSKVPPTIPPPPQDRASPPPLPLSYIGPPPSPPPPNGTIGGSLSGSSNDSSNSTGVIVAVVVTAVFLVALIFSYFYFFRRKKRKHYLHPPPTLRPTSPQSFEELSKPSASLTATSYGQSQTQYVPLETQSYGVSTIRFTYEDLKAATNDFSQENLLGKGGFGNVYKGIISGGKVVAVKQMNIGGGQGEREFQAEVDIISRVHHRHLVTLVGYCIMQDQRLLVYDYVPNRTLEYHLHEKKTPVLSWKIRQRIALGAAKGLAYLHEDCHPRIIHRDIKSANILIDNNFEALVSDFGLAKLTPDANTHVTTRVMGTFGYLAPEYASSGKLTDKSDVFSFGVVLLELLTGRRPVCPSQYEDSLVEWARPLLTQVLEQRNFDIIVDPNLNNDYDDSEMMRVVEAAAACIRYSANKRPKMGLVVRALEEEASVAELNEGVLPGQSSLYSMGGSIDYDSTQYRTDMKKFRQAVLGSQEYGSSTDYSDRPSSSEYGPKSMMFSSDFQSSQEVDRNPGRA